MAGKEHKERYPTGAEHYGGRLGSSIGRGSFSQVFQAHCAKKGKDVAIKVMPLENVLTSLEDILQEVQTMRLCNDVNILRCYCSFVHGDQLWLVTQLMDMGSCLRVMSVAKSLGFGEGMNEEWLAYILREALQGLCYLHKNGHIHRDIKAGNVLLDSQGRVRLADFGVSGWTLSGGQRQETASTFVGTPCYMAPEVMEQAGGYDNRADIWSLGITTLELAKGRAPYAHLSPMRILVVTIEDEPPSLRSYSNDRQRSGAPFSKEFDDFASKCLQKNPRSRQSADELLRHKFLRGRSPEALVKQLLEQIGPVGQSPQDQRTTSSAVGLGVVAIERVASAASSLPSEQADVVSSAVLTQTQETASAVASSSSSTASHLPQPQSSSAHAFSPVDSSSRLEEGTTERGTSYVAGTTWVFDGDGDEYRLRAKGVLGMSGGLLRVTALRPRASNASGGGASAAQATSDPSPSLADFLSDFEEQAATIKSTPPTAAAAKALETPENETAAFDAGKEKFIDELDELVDNSC